MTPPVGPCENCGLPAYVNPTAVCPACAGLTGIILREVRRQLESYVTEHPLWFVRGIRLEAECIAAWALWPFFLGVRKLSRRLSPPRAAP